jgi:hypothetical protein
MILWVKRMVSFHDRVLTRYGSDQGSFQLTRIMSINPEYMKMGTCVKYSFDHVCLYEEELRTSESSGQM